MNGYTGGMANYSGTISSTSITHHDAGLPNSTASPAAHTKPGLPTGGIRTAFHTGALAAAPAPKKAKPDADALTAPPLNLTLQQHQQLLGMAPQLLHGLMGGVHSGLQPLPAMTAAAPTQIAHVAASGGIALPVGVGIRLGGIGGVAPATAQTRVGLPGGGAVMGAHQYSHNVLWNSGVDPAELGMSEAAITERRQRNREHAKRSRVRKKFMLESLQEQVRGLQRENNGLRLLVQEHIPEHALQIISDCCTDNPLFGDAGESGGTNVPSGAAGDATGQLERSDFSLMQSLAAGQKCFVLSDPKLPDNPIVFATPDFYKLTGYTSEEVLGRNCRFLQGPGTDKRAVDVIRKAIAAGSDATVCLINYKQDGTPFWNQFFIAALRDSDNNIVNFVSGRSFCLAVPAVRVTPFSLVFHFVSHMPRSACKPK